MSKIDIEEKKKAIGILRKLLKSGKYRVYTILRRVSRTGMSRVISSYTIIGNKPVWLDGYISRLGFTRVNGWMDGIRVGGCGMDMGFHLIYEVSHILWPKGYNCDGNECVSNAHTNGDLDYSKKNHHNDGGYRLKQDWI